MSSIDPRFSPFFWRALAKRADELEARSALAESMGKTSLRNDLEMQAQTIRDLALELSTPTGIAAFFVVVE